MQFPFFTIGHSDHSIEAFVSMLKSADIRLLVDVRKMPASRANPQFNEDQLKVSLAQSQIAYERIADLGGLRSRRKTVASTVNAFWTNRSFHNYADYALSDDFRRGFEELVTHGSRQICAIMCSEAVWWRCHRRIIADYLIADGKTVYNIMGENRFDPADLTSGAVVQANGTIVYPSPTEPVIA